MSETDIRSATAFEGRRRLASGPLGQVALAVKAAAEREGHDPLLVFDDTTGRVVDLDLRGSADEVLARLAAPPPEPPPPRGRGRPKLGVVAREVTLLPRHWDWLTAQPGGASAALRRLVEEARRASGPADQARAAQEAAYRFMAALAGDLPGYEETLRALYAGNRARFTALAKAWPEDVADYAVSLAFGSGD